MVQVVSFDNLEDQELEKREVTEGSFVMCCLNFNIYLVMIARNSLTD